MQKSDSEVHNIIHVFCRCICWAGTCVDDQKVRNHPFYGAQNYDWAKKSCVSTKIEDMEMVLVYEWLKHIVLFSRAFFVRLQNWAMGPDRTPDS